MEDAALDELRPLLAKGLGAAHAWVVALPIEETLAQLGLDGHPLHRALSQTSPLTCEDLREQGREARAHNEPLVVDNTLPTFVGCAAVRLGAHVSLEPLQEDVTLVGISKDAERALPGLHALLERLPAPDAATCEALLSSLPEREHAWHASSDAAQVVASYLACHPRVEEVRYPGIKKDPSFEVAARTLTGGFGPLVDYRMSDGWHRLACESADPRQMVLRLEDKFKQ